MSEFRVIKRYDMPASFPAVVAVTNEDDLHLYEAWCYKFLGNKAGQGDRTAKWFQSRGVFFFAGEAVSRYFMRNASLIGQSRIAAMVSNRQSGSAIDAKLLQNRLQHEFQAH